MRYFIDCNGSIFHIDQHGASDCPHGEVVVSKRTINFAGLSASYDIVQILGKDGEVLDECTLHESLKCLAEEVEG